MSNQNENGVHLFDACVYDSNLKCVTTTCKQCIQAENEWTNKWIEYLENPNSSPDPPHARAQNA